MIDHDCIDRILSLLSLYWHAKPGFRLGQIVGNFTPTTHLGGDTYQFGDSYLVEDAVVEERLTNAIAALDFKPIARHPAGCVAHSNEVAAWLRDGTKVVLRRDPQTKGRAWLEVEKQATVHVAGEKPAPMSTDALLKNAGLLEALRDSGQNLGDEEQAARVAKELGIPLREHDVAKPYHDRLHEWVEIHREELARYPNQFVAIDPDEGVVISDPTDDGFSEKLMQLDAEKRRHLLTTHTSLYGYAAVCKTCGANPAEELSIEHDPIAEWMTSHPDEVARCAGKHIAVHPERGIVASGETFAEVHEQVKTLGWLSSEVAFDVVGLAPDPPRDPFGLEMCRGITPPQEDDPLADLKRCIEDIKAGKEPEASPELLALAEEACAHPAKLDTPEEVGAWAKRLASDLVEAGIRDDDRWKR